MVGDLRQICCKAQSSSSSSTGIFCDNNNKCSPCRCDRCCPNAIINDHTYALLKRICRKIIKNYNRQQCREKYTIFDGGNSVNLRIHRESSLYKQDLERDLKYQNNINPIGFRDQRRQSGRRIDNLLSSKGSPGRHGISEESDKGQLEKNVKSKSKRRASEPDQKDGTVGKEASTKATNDYDKGQLEKNVKSKSKRRASEPDQKGGTEGKVANIKATSDYEIKGRNDYKKKFESGGKKPKGVQKQEESDNDDFKDDKKHKSQTVAKNNNYSNKPDGRGNAAILATEKTKDKKIVSNDKGPSSNEKYESNKINNLDENEKKSSKQRQSEKVIAIDKNKKRPINKDDIFDKETGKDHIKRKSGKDKKSGVGKGKETAEEGMTLRHLTNASLDASTKKDIIYKKSKIEKNKAEIISNRKSNIDRSKAQNRRTTYSHSIENGGKRSTKSIKGTGKKHISEIVVGRHGFRRDKIEDNEFGTPRASKKGKFGRRLDSLKGKYPNKKQQKSQKYGSEKSKTNVEKLYQRIINRSRADEIKPCDVLRAQLEQRDLARSHGDPCQPCYPCRSCLPCQPSCVFNICQRQNSVC